MRPPNLIRLTLHLTIIVTVAVFTLSAKESLSQSNRIEPRQEDGFNRFETERLTLITDLQIDDELKRWPVYLDQAIEQWQRIFRRESSKQRKLHTTVHLIGDRKKWETAGLLTNVPAFEEGYQFGSKLYLIEQPSIFYRRMLFLHEATHWIMSEWLGGAGSPWLMEGMADYLGTHRLEGDRITLGYFPISPDEVPWWGRIRQVQESIKQGNAPKLSEILSFPNSRTSRMEQYCWSWCAVYFFDNHPEYNEDFRRLYRGDLDYSLAASKQLYSSLAEVWPRLSIQWRCFLDDLDFGYQPQLMLRWGEEPLQSLKPNDAHTIAVSADLGWQSTGVVLEPGDSLLVQASGAVVVRQFTDGTTWESTPKGISVEYVRENRLGALVGALAPLDEEQPSRPWERILIGTDQTIIAKERSCLLLRINDTAAGVNDNTGSYKVQLRRATGGVDGR